MDRSEASALADLQMHWDEAYAIGLDGDIWSARFHGSADELRAHTSSELRELIRADYAYRTRADAARARREAAAEREASRRCDTSRRDADADAEDSSSGYNPDALAGYGDASDGPSTDRLPERAEFAGIREERMST